VGSDGSKYTFTIKNYKAEFKKDDITGWYLSKETYDWESSDAKPSESSAGSKAASGGSTSSAATTNNGKVSTAVLTK
jgi:hypothetical protein